MKGAKALDKLRKLLKWGKVIFFFAVIVIVGSEFKGLLAQTSLQGVSENLQALTWWQILAIMLIGFLTVVPCIGYDKLFLDTVDKKVSVSELLTTSYSINAIENLVGFGGLTSIVLRNSYYGDDDPENKERFMQACTNAVPFMISGLGVMSLLAFIFTWIDAYDYAPVNRGILLLMSGGIVTMLLIFNRLKTQYVGGLPLRMQLKYIGASILEWGAYALSFLIVGELLGYSFAWMPMFIALILAEIAGYFSFIPGALGSFDLVMIGFLSFQGFSYEQSMVWVLVFRIAYYIVPFILAVIIFFNHFWKKYTSDVKEPIKFIARNIAYWIGIGMVLLLAVFLILSATIPDRLTAVHWLHALNPIHANLIWKFPSMLIGYLLMLVARVLMNRQHQALTLSMVLLIITLIYMNLTGFNVLTAVYILLMISLIWLSRPLLYRKQFLYSWESATIDMGLLVLLTFVYIYFYWRNLPINMGNSSLKLINFIRDQHTFGLLLLMITIIVAFWWIVLVTLQHANMVIGEPVDTQRAQKLLEKYGGHDDSGLVFLRDKQLYWVTDGNGEDRMAFQLMTVNNKVIVMGDPFGDDTYLDAALEEFVGKCDWYGYSVVFYEISERLTLKLHEYGYGFMKVGESGVVDLENFTLSGRKKRPLRYVINKFTNDGYRFEIVHAPHNTQLLDQLEQISDTWLNGRMEKGFSMGFFDRDYLQMGDIAIVYDADSTPIAFANIMPVYEQGMMSVDLMRYNLTDAPNGLMDYLFINLFTYAQANGYQSFDLGMAPLSKVGHTLHSYTLERFAYYAYVFGTRFYSFQGLRSYKEKFTNRWLPKYISFSRGSWRLYSIIALLLVTSRTVKTTTDD